MKKIIVFLTLMLALNGCATHSGLFHHKTSPEEAFDRAASLINNKYIDSSGNKIHLDTSMRPDVSTLVEQLDSSARLIGIEEIEINNWPGAAVGIFFRLIDGTVEVMKTYQDSPARKAGIQRGDKLLEINGVPLYGLSHVQIAKMLQGEKGSEISLKVRTKTGSREVKLIREVLKPYKTTAGNLIEGDIGYIRIDSFWPDSLDEVRKMVKSLRSRKMRAMVLDLRNNSGGLLRAATDIAQIFLEHGKTITTLIYASDTEKEIIQSKGWRWSHYTDFPMVILVDAKTESGAEIVAASLRDNNRAILVGEKTAGKVEIRGTYPLGDGRLLQFRIAKENAPAGQSIDGRGLRPDSEVTISEGEREELYDKISLLTDDQIGSSFSDPQLKTAVKGLLESAH